MNYFKTSIIFIIIIFLLTGCSSVKQEIKTPDYNEIVATIMPLIEECRIKTDALDMLSGSLNINSTEGNHFSAWLENGDLLFYELTVFGEYGRTTYSFYQLDNSVYLEYINARYNVPIYLTEDNEDVKSGACEAFDPKKTLFETMRFISENGNLSILDFDNKIISDVNDEQQRIFIEAAGYALDIINGSYDLDIEELIILEDKIASWYDYDDYTFPLVAAIPEREIYLYSIKGTYTDCVLYVGDVGHYYEIPGSTYFNYLPEMKVDDFDNDGEEELAIKYCYGTGTGAAKWGFSIIKINTETEYRSDPWPIYTFDPSDYLEQVEKAVSSKVIGTNKDTLELTVGNKKSVINFSDSLWDEDYMTGKCWFGDIIHVIFDGNAIRAEFEVGAFHKNWVTPDYFGTIYADCIFSDGAFTLSNITFLTYREREIEKLRFQVENQKELFFPESSYPKDFDSYEIINVVEYSSGEGLFILQMNDGFEFDKVYLVRCVDKVIVDVKMLSDSCVSLAKFVSVGGFKNYFVAFYYSTHLDNGGMTLYSLDPDAPSFDFYGVYDANREFMEYPELQKIFPSKNFSFIYENDCLDVYYAYPYNDEKCIITFRGTQLLLDDNENIIDKSECVFAFNYYEYPRRMVLSFADCVFPKYWSYNVNTVGANIRQ